MWPELEVVAEARNGREAVRLFDERHPDICFLDVHMPGLSGVDAANHIGRRAHLVFVTAYDHYAVQAFAQGALDYLVKPVEAGASRRDGEPPEGTSAVVAAGAQHRAAACSSSARSSRGCRQRERRTAALDSRAGGQTVRLIAIDEVDYLRSDAKYTLVAWRDGGKPAEAVVRTPLKDLRRAARFRSSSRRFIARSS